MIDISTAGAKVRIVGGGETIEVTQFSDEGTPFECADVDLSENKKNLNGQMISSRTPSVYPVSVTVIAGSPEDLKLTRIAQKSAIMPGSVNPIANLIIEKIELMVPNINQSSGDAGSNCRTYTWTYGRMKTAPTGPSSSAEGRQAARTYTFEMERFTAPMGAGTSITNM